MSKSLKSLFADKLLSDGNFRQEANRIKTAEDLSAFAAKYHVSYQKGQEKALLLQIRQMLMEKGEVSDEELEAVSGGNDPLGGMWPPEGC